MSGFLHPNALVQLRRFFRSTCDIQAATKSQDTFGAESRTWTTIPQLDGIRCVVGNRSTLQRLAGQTQPEMLSGLVALLAGDYGDIVTTDMRIVVDGVDEYMVTDVTRSQGNDLTALGISRVN